MLFRKHPGCCFWICIVDDIGWGRIVVFLSRSCWILKVLCPLFFLMSYF